MNRLLARTGLVGCVVGCLSLAACNDPAQQAEIDQAVATATSLAVKTCGYEPTAETLINIAQTFLPQYAAAGDLAVTVVQSICNAVTAKSVRRGGSAPMARGGNGDLIPIKGHFVR